MQIFEMITAIVAVTSICEVLKAFARRGPKESKQLVAEVRALREELGAMKRQQNEIFLSIDASLDHMNRQALKEPRGVDPLHASSRSESL